MRYTAKGFQLVFLVLATFFAKISNAQDRFVFEGNRTQEMLSFTKSRGLIVLPMYINGGGPFNFILDTGVGSVIITDASLKDSLNLKYLRKIEIEGLGENDKLIAYSTPFLELKVGSSVFKNASAAILGLNEFNLSEYFGMPIHGLLGYDFFSSFIVKINYEANSLKIFTQEKPRLVKKGTKIPINFIDKKPFIDAMVQTDEGKKLMLKLLIDSGSGHPLSLESFENRPFDLPNRFVEANLGVGLNGNISGLQGRIASLSIGKFVLNDVLSSFPFFDDVGSKVNLATRNGSIGNPLLTRFNVVFDYQKNHVFLKPLSTFRRPFAYDKSGMELIAGGEKFDRYFVTRVEPNSAAADFGMLVGDEILTINFNKVSTLGMSEILRVLSSDEGRTLFVETARGSTFKYGILKLKKRI